MECGTNLLIGFSTESVPPFSDIEMVFPVLLTSAWLVTLQKNVELCQQQLPDPIPIHFYSARKDVFRSFPYLQEGFRQMKEEFLQLILLSLQLEGRFLHLISGSLQVPDCSSGIHRNRQKLPVLSLYLPESFRMIGTF